jgi:Leucine-rich repeat (LRR) protein
MLGTGCAELGQYDITVNNVTVYEPAAPYTASGIEDPALAACLTQSLLDIDARAATDLAALNCSDAGIQSLTGLEQFTQIQSMKLSSNNIRNLLVIERLTALRQLWLDDNDVVDPIPVLRMTALKELNLTGNLRLQCPDPADVPRHMSMNLPDHCTR